MQAMDQMAMTMQAWGMGKRSFGRALVLAAGMFCAGLLAPALPAQANPFEPVITVNGRAITQYEYDQRLLFLQILNQPGDLEEMARTSLIEDRLRSFAAKDAGVTLSPDQVKSGMTEFAGRANMTAEEFIEATGQMGLDPESFRDFVEAGMAWREVVRAKFAGKVTITEAEIDRAIANFKPTGVPTLSLAELVFPASASGDLSGALAKARQTQARIKTEADFAAEARTHGGGARGWQKLADLPEKSRERLERLAPGSMTAPVLLDDKVVIYWLFERAEEPLGKADATVLDYAEYLVPAGAGAEAELASVRARVDTCDDLYTVAKGQPADRLTRQTQPQGAVGGDVGAVLATLDAGESSTRISRAGWRVFLMLCSRGPAKDLVPSREIIREQLLNQRLSSLADIYLEELRSEAILVEK